MFTRAVRDACRAAAMQADSCSRSGQVTPSDDFHALICQFFEADPSLVHVVCSRVRSFMRELRDMEAEARKLGLSMPQYLAIQRADAERKRRVAARKQQRDMQHESFKQFEHDRHQAVSTTDQMTRSKTCSLTTGLAQRKPSLEEKLRCTECNESRSEYVRYDPDMGSTTCTSCGCVLAWNQVVSTQWVRTFEGEEDARQHGPVADMRMSLPSHTETKVCKKFESVQKKVYSKSQYVVKQGTTLAYKDNHKKRAFALIDSACGPCCISARVANVAKDIFASFREHKETIHHMDALIAACVIVGTELVEEKVKKSETSVVCSFKCSSCLKEFPSKKGLRFHTCAAQVSTSLSHLRPRSLSAYRHRLRSFDVVNHQSPVPIKSGICTPSSSSSRDDRVSPFKRTRDSRSGPIEVLRPTTIRVESIKRVPFKQD